ncbi:MAG: hypothetical protein ACOCS7_03565 [Halolamina sp.]
MYQALVTALDRFGGTEPERRTVARQAVDLADSGRYRSDSGRRLTVDLVVDELADAPDGSPADRWNWWIGVLSLAYGGYEEFAVDRYPKSGT